MTRRGLPRRRNGGLSRRLRPSTCLPLHVLRATIFILSGVPHTPPRHYPVLPLLLYDVYCRLVTNITLLFHACTLL